MIKTVVGSFDSFEEAREVVRDLKDDGFMESDISIVANNSSGDDSSQDDADIGRSDADMRTSGSIGMGSGSDMRTTGSSGMGSGSDMRSGSAGSVGTAGSSGMSAGSDMRSGSGNASSTGSTGYSGSGTTTGYAGSGTGAGYAASGLTGGTRDGVLDPSLTGDTARESSVGGSTMSDTPDTTRTGDATGAATGAVTGGVLGGAAGVALSLMGLAIPGIGPILAAGPIVAGLTGAGVGAVAGGLIGGLTGLGVSEEHAEYYAESVRRGGALVTIRCDESRAERAAQIMQDHGAVDIERRVERWRDTGWSGFDANAQPFGSDQIAQERTGSGASSGSDTSAGARSSRSRATTDWSAMEDDFRREHDQEYAGQSASFDDYAPAYRYGYETAQKDTYRGRGWNDVESDLRGDWERSNPGRGWEQFKAAVRRGWDRLTGDSSTMSSDRDSGLSASRSDDSRR